MMFRSRTDAGRALARALMAYKGQHPVVLALPRGGVPVAAEVAQTLGGVLDLLLVRKIGVPQQPELAMGAVADGEKPLVIRNEDVIQLAGVSEAAFEEVCSAERAEIERRRKRYLGDRPRAPLRGRLVIIVDDGIATGATTLAAIRAVRAVQPSKLVLAVPVAPPEAIKRLRSEVDALICLETPHLFGAIGFFYRDFEQVSDEEVCAILNRSAEPAPSRRR
jgi:predicted phosphoribosyltransferase